jgi:predicted Zn-dependent protease
MSDPRARVAEAHRALAAGDLVRASQLADELLAHHAGFPPAVHLAGLIARSAGDLSRAEDLMRRSLEMPGVTGRMRAEFGNNLGNLLWMAGFTAAAGAAYRMALEAHDLPQARVGLGRTLLAQDAPDEALAVLRRVPLAAAGASGLVLLSEALAQVGERAEALDVLLGAGEPLRAQPQLRVAIGQRLGGLGRHGEAEAALLPLLDGPAEVTARLALAELRVSQQRWEAGLEVLQGGIARHPSHTELLTRAAALAWMLGDAARFADALRRAVERHPRDGGLRLALAGTLENAGFAEESERALREGIERGVPDFRLHALLARRCAETGRMAEATRLAAQALAGHPELELVREQAAVVALVGQRAEEALTHTGWLLQRRPLGQFALALHVLALRLAGDARWERLADPQRVCRVATLDAPAGFDSIEAFNAALGERLRGRHTLKAHPLLNSVRGGTQVEIDPATETDPLLGQFFALIEGAVGDFVRAMPIDDGHPLFGRRSERFRLSGCWTVRLTGSSGSHVSHMHPRGWLSSAYYVSVPPELAGNPSRAGWLSFGRPPYPVAGLEPTGWVEPRPGRLALFPSYQWHGVERFPGDGERMTIAFDVVPRIA